MALVLTKEEYERKKAMISKAEMLKKKAQEKISSIKDMEKAIRLEDMIALYRMNVMKSPDINKFDDAAIEIAMIPIYETIITE